uniref:BY PROTMAP: gi/342321267/gb/EGU13201.1/ Catalytic activity: RhaA is able to hydrolyze alpha-1 [Rhodotorula glutinis ATCC 204091] n=1 Tax=Rhodotorula toruloides TaxID=5286 RepID=A0A0K3CKK1_RHOTO
MTAPPPRPLADFASHNRRKARSTRHAFSVTLIRLLRLMLPGARPRLLGWRHKSQRRLNRFADIPRCKQTIAGPPAKQASGTCSQSSPTPRDLVAENTHSPRPLPCFSASFSCSPPPLQARSAMKGLHLALLATLAGSYTKPDGPVKVYPGSVNKGLTSEHANASISLKNEGDLYTRKSRSFALFLPAWRSSWSPFAVDYGRDVAGRPFFEVTALGSPYAQLEIKYTELSINYSDGPFPFSNGLSSEFRVETLNVTKTGELASFFIQGSQRWESVKLIKGQGVEIKSAEFISSVDEAPPSTWEVDSNKGVYIRGQKPATTVKGANAKNYTLAFEANIDYGGVGWRLDTEIDNIFAEGPYLVLTSNYPEGSFVNYNHSLVPPSTLVLGRGWSLQNQTTLTGWHLDSFPVGFDVTEKTWHNIETDSPGDGTYTVRLDGKQIAHFNLTAYNVGARPPYFPPCAYYSFALGPWQDQAAWYRNVNVTLASGQNWYSNPMTSEDIKVEYGVATNDFTVCSDAGKRDRYSWLGDRQISARSVEAVGEFEYVSGPAEQAFARQIASGEVPSNMLFSQLDPLGVQGRTESLDLILVDWESKFFDIIYHYWQKTGNDSFLQAHWGDMRAMMAYVMQTSIDPQTSFGTNGGSGPAISSTALNIIALEEMAEMGSHLGYSSAVAAYQVQANLSRKALEGLWNETGGFYAFPGKEYSIDDMAWIELAKIGTAERRDKFWSHLPSRQVPGGYVDPPADNKFDLLGGGVKISMNIAADLLWGLGERGDGKTAQDLVKRTYGPMVERGVNYTGAYWEFLSADGTYPGNDLETAQSHFWGGFPPPTAFLTEYVLGVKPTTPGFATFEVAPISGWKDDWVEGRVPTPHGLIYTAWGYDSAGKLHMEVTAPKGTTSTIKPPFEGLFSVNGKAGQSGTVKVDGGKGKVMIVQQ